MPCKFRPVTHVLFDLDGLLQNTEPIYESVFKDLCEKFGNALTPEVRVKLLGTTEHLSFQYCVNDLKLKCTVEEFEQEFRKLSNERVKDSPLMPGAERLVRHLHANKIPICVASGSSQESMAIKTKKHMAVYELFHHMTSGSDPEVKAGKPAPDVFLVAASRFDSKVEPENCLVLEDSPNGVLGAVAAGMQVVMVPADNITDEQKSKATIVLKSLEDFQPEMFGLPAFN